MLDRCTFTSQVCHSQAKDQLISHSWYSTVRVVLDQARLLQELQELKQEWQDAAGDLSDVRVNLDELFNDFRDILTPEVQGEAREGTRDIHLSGEENQPRSLPGALQGPF